VGHVGKTIIRQIRNRNKKNRLHAKHTSPPSTCSCLYLDLDLDLTPDLEMLDAKIQLGIGPEQSH
jgi:hypothetical protein